MMTPGYRASSCQKEASGSYFDFVLEGAFSIGKYISVDRAGRTFSAKQAALPDPLRIAFN